ncbi:hypothetical protein [Chondromyces crocatus]|uniref:Membrane protein n=1 Tax=Chondromyces crocatus TaxID=52 RepID=A0A0K1EQ92_CHOCO|nr:hypothetical protein [Chondromyces crocatus]AKT42989.1 membrane protein [Chondromyces crocatus]
MNSLSSIGILHTVVSLFAIPLGAIAFVRGGRIDVATRVGKLYVVATALGALTAFGVIKTPVGFGLAVGTLLALLVGVAAPHLSWLGRARRYTETIALSVSFFFVLLPGITETLTRLPVSQPLASGLDSPVLRVAHLGLVTGLIAGVAYQVTRLRVGSRVV